MRRRGAVLLSGASLLAVGWLLGSVTLALAGLGLLVAAGLAAGWARLVRTGVRVERGPVPRTLVEGETLAVEVAVHGATLLPGSVRFRDALGPVQAREVALRRAGPVRVVFTDVARGVHRLGPGTVVLEDPLGLGRVELVGAAGPLVRVRPRVIALTTTFLDGPTGIARDGRRGLLRADGTEPHGVREHRDGESLRSVHWATSARTGRLMVRETEDPGRDDVSIVLDLDTAGTAGPAGRSSLDDAVRAAAALVHAGTARGRHVGLVLAGHEPARFAVRGGVGWDDALDALAAAAAVRGAVTGAVLADLARGGARHGIVLVTGRPLATFADLLLRRGRCAVVAVDAPTYAGAPRSTVEPALLRLAARGVPVAVLRAGDELAAVLGAQAEAARA